MRKIHAFDKGIYNPFKSSNVSINVNKATKENKVFFTEDFFKEEDKRPWEVRYDNTYPNVFYDSIAKKYRVYYSTFSIDKGSSEYSLEERKNNTYQPSTERVVSLCYAESENGVDWVKPNLGITEWNGSKSNNIIGSYLHGTSVFLDEHESDKDKRYKMFTKIDYGNGIHYLAVAFSKDGIKFDDFIEIPDFNPRADTHNSIIYDETLNKYVLITREWRDSMRVACISMSSDFINWSPVEEILYPRGYANQIYSMPIFIEGDYRIGLASMYHEGDENHTNHDTVDLELAYTYKYKGWNYIDPGSSFIERGEGNYSSGDFDNSIIFSGLPIKEGNRTYFYYMGGNGQHTNFREASFSRAYIEHDRYSYIAPKNEDQEAVVNTNGFVFLSDEIYIDADIEEEGKIEIEFFTFEHQKIENVNIELEKSGHLYKLKIDKDLKRKITRMIILLKKAKIYSFQGDIEVFRVEDDNSLLRL